jgi:hypothetical protein
MGRTVRIALTSLRFHEDADVVGSDEVRVRLRLAGREVGDLSQRFQMVEGTSVTLDAGTWGADFDYAATGQVEATVEVEDDDVSGWESRGRVRLLLRWPFTARSYTLRAGSGDFSATFTVTQRTDAAGDDPGWGSTFVPRRETGGTAAATVAARPPMRIEVHDCLPVPTGAGTPVRPASLAGVIADLDELQEAVSPSGPNNVFYNPAVIPIIPSGQVRSGENCAKFKVTYICDPAATSTRMSMPELRWEVRSLGGQATIFGSRSGRKVSVHGTRRGEVLLQLFHGSTIAGAVRALVEPLVLVPCRATLLTTGGATPTANTATPAQVLEQLNCANRYLWQLGVLLRLESDTSVGWLPSDVPAANVTTTGTTGVFRAVAPASYISNIPNGSLSPCINARPNVMNFVYMVSKASGSVTGAACDFGGNTTSQADDGTPSTSWAPPSGVPPAGDAGSNSITCYNLRRPGRPADVFTMIIAENGHRTSARIGCTIAHEVGHCMGLGHRGRKPDGTNPAYYDGMTHPVNENIMYYSAVDNKMDFDIIQAKAVRHSPLVRHA